MINWTVVGQLSRHGHHDTPPISSSAAGERAFDGSTEIAVPDIDRPDGL